MELFLILFGAFMLIAICVLVLLHLAGKAKFRIERTDRKP